MKRWVVGLSAALAVSILLTITSPPAQSQTYSFGAIIWRSPTLRDSDFDNMRRFHRTALIKVELP